MERPRTAVDPRVPRGRRTLKLHPAPTVLLRGGDSDEGPTAAQPAGAPAQEGRREPRRTPHRRGVVEAARARRRRVRRGRRRAGAARAVGVGLRGGDAAGAEERPRGARALPRRLRFGRARHRPRPARRDDRAGQPLLLADHRLRRRRPREDEARRSLRRVRLVPDRAHRHVVTLRVRDAAQGRRRAHARGGRVDRRRRRATARVLRVRRRRRHRAPPHGVRAEAGAEARDRRAARLGYRPRDQHPDPVRGRQHLVHRRMRSAISERSS